MIKQSFTCGRLTVGLLALAGVFLQGCADTTRGSAEPSGRVFASDMAGRARQCDSKAPSLTDGQPAQAAMKMSNEGGWCNLTLPQRSGKPFESALMVTRPNNGRVLVHRVGDSTRVDYTPKAGFTGDDTFTVKLVPGDSSVRVTVNVAK